MPNIKSAKKRVLVNAKKTEQNKSIRSAVKTEMKKIDLLIKENKLDDKVELGGTFCMGNCQKGVCVTVDDTFHSVTPDSTKEFFEKQVLAKV